MFEKILIANRGEIACRVIKSARKMGIKTVAVYSEADAGALHTEMADETVAIGPPAAAESYLVIDKILAAIRETGAQAVHPGYGFLSENQAFAQALDKAGISFIGPNVRAIAAMGDKIESKKLANEAKVNTVPGYLGVIDTAEEAVGIARDIGYPVMIKASAGGGGKGMRIARSDDEVREGYQSAKNEALSSFADDRVFVEKFIEEPRHIEIQVLADAHGNCIYLGERECSIQRRHQKVIEEAPSPFLDEATRKAMGEQAVALAKAVDYRSAGTVEFIVDRDRNFYFLEMNTRLQVEHPVTELITGIDLVEQMIRVAAGEKLTISQADIRLNGWAIESRVYAEDPYRGFLPSIGRLTHCRFPDDSVTTRTDTGVVEGSEITMFYDPMIAKVCGYGKTRNEAIQHMRAALDSCYIRGISHNVPFLAAVLAHPRFEAGNLTTNFIDEEYPDGFSGGTMDAPELEAMLAAAALIHQRNACRDATVSGQLHAEDLAVRANWVVCLDGKQHPVELIDAEGGYDVVMDSHTLAVQSDWVPGKNLFEGRVNNRHVVVQVERIRDGYRLLHGGVEMNVAVRTPRGAELAALMPIKEAPDMSRFLVSPMPGLIRSLEVEVGQAVKGGQALVVVEAMKMENALRAERDGVVARVAAQAGDSVAVDEVILEFE